MKKLGLALIILLILGVTAVVTCPDKEAHKDAITKVINEVVQDELGVFGHVFTFSKEDIKEYLH